jgi:hypothetical protein
MTLLQAHTFSSLTILDSKHRHCLGSVAEKINSQSISLDLEQDQISPEQKHAHAGQHLLTQMIHIYPLRMHFQYTLQLVV